MTRAKCVLSRVDPSTELLFPTSVKGSPHSAKEAGLPKDLNRDKGSGLHWAQWGSTVADHQGYHAEGLRAHQFLMWFKSKTLQTRIFMKNQLTRSKDMKISSDYRNETFPGHSTL